MAILASNIKFYQCLVQTEGDSHGGDIDLANVITSGIDGNIFDDVSNQERIDGKTEYRKIFIRNENSGDGSDWETIKAWISQFTPADNDEIWMTVEGNNNDTQLNAKSYTSWVQPDTKSHADVLDIGTLQTNEYYHVWLKRIVTPGGAGYSGNNFKLTFESS